MYVYAQDQVIEWNDHSFIVQYVFQPAMLDPGHGMDRVEKEWLYSPDTPSQSGATSYSLGGQCVCVCACMCACLRGIWKLE